MKNRQTYFFSAPFTFANQIKLVTTIHSGNIDLIMRRPLATDLEALKFISALSHIFSAEQLKTIGDMRIYLRLQAFLHRIDLTELKKAFIGKNGSKPEPEKRVCHLVKSFF